MVNLYIEKNNKVTQYYDLPEILVRMVYNMVDNVMTSSVETEDGYKVNIVKIEKDK